jgi:hypothetical protein
VDGGVAGRGGHARWRRRRGAAEGNGGGGYMGERDLVRYRRLGIARGDWWTRAQRRLFHVRPPHLVRTRQLTLSSTLSAHLVTSAIFLPKLVLNEDGSSSVSGLSFASRLLLLQTYLAVAAAWYIMRGNDHALPIGDFYAATDTQLFAPSRAGSANTGWTQAPGSAWPRVFQSAVRFQDEHMPKIARALGNFAVRWGTRAPGYFAVTGEEEKARMGAGLAPALEGIERLDGTLFVRVAGLTFDRLGWVDEGETAGRWDLDGIPMMGVHGEDKCTAQLLADLV